MSTDRMSTLRDELQKIPIERVVDNAVYYAPAVFEAELELIFDRVWHFACHESEIPDTGDFVTMILAGIPIVVTRDHDRQVRAYHNTCRHRGSLVVSEERGHCGAFRCPYHSWVYSLEGELVTIPGQEAYDGSGFHKEDFPLVEAKCDSVLGLVFVSVNEMPIPLRDWLGEAMIDVLSKPLANGDYEVFQESRHELDVNWKVFAENARDGYHVPFVHPFFRKASPPGPYHLFAHGQAVQYLEMDPDGIEPDLWDKLRRHPLPGVEVGFGYIVNIFPDMTLTVRSNVVSIDYQRIVGPTRTIMENRTLGLADDTAEMRELRSLSQKVWFADPVELEDLVVFAYQQAGVSNRMVRHSVIARGADADTGTRGDDNRLRQFWQEWRRLMGVDANSLEIGP